MLQEALSVLLQVDAADGNKVVTVRAPLQVGKNLIRGSGGEMSFLTVCSFFFKIRNHFSMPFTIMKYCPTSRSLQSVGEAEPDTEFHITLDAYR